MPYAGSCGDLMSMTLYPVTVFDRIPFELWNLGANICIKSFRTHTGPSHIDYNAFLWIDPVLTPSLCYMHCCLPFSTPLPNDRAKWSQASATVIYGLGNALVAIIIMLRPNRMRTSKGPGLPIKNKTRERGVLCCWTVDIYLNLLKSRRWGTDESRF